MCSYFLCFSAQVITIYLGLMCTVLKRLGIEILPEKDRNIDICIGILDIFLNFLLIWIKSALSQQCLF